MGEKVKLPYSSKINKKNLDSAELRRSLLHFLHSISEKKGLFHKQYATPSQPQETIPHFKISYGMAWIYFTLSEYPLHNFPPLPLITPLGKLVFAFALTAAALELQGTGL